MGILIDYKFAIMESLSDDSTDLFDRNYYGKLTNDDGEVYHDDIAHSAYWHGIED